MNTAELCLFELSQIHTHTHTHTHTHAHMLNTYVPAQDMPVDTRVVYVDDDDVSMP